jgi:hypothetical protein
MDAGYLGSEELDKDVLYEWQVACFAALKESDPAKISELLQEANKAIQRRLSRLEPWPDGREMTALNEAVQALRAHRDRWKD